VVTFASVLGSDPPFMTLRHVMYRDILHGELRQGLDFSCRELVRVDKRFGLIIEILASPRRKRRVSIRRQSNVDKGAYLDRRHRLATARETNVSTTKKEISSSTGGQNRGGRGVEFDETTRVFHLVFP
jgi:hypothetical protein